MIVWGNIKRAACLAMVAGAIGFSASARGSIQISITDTNSLDPSHPVTVMASSPNNPGTSAIYAGPLGNFSNIIVSAQTVIENGNTADLRDVVLNGTDNAAGGTDTVLLIVSGGDFTVPSGSSVTVTSTLTSSSLSAGATARFTSSLTSGSFANPSTDPLFITGNGQTSQVGVTSTNDSAPNIPASSNGTFQLTNQLSAVFSPGQSGVLDATTEATATSISPEPSSIMLAMAGGCVALVMRRRNAVSVR